MGSKLRGGHAGKPPKDFREMALVGIAQCQSILYERGISRDEFPACVLDAQLANVLPDSAFEVLSKLTCQMNGMHADGFCELLVRRGL